jgi:hypothetical protein
MSLLYLESLAESRRLTILRLLSEVGGGSNESVIHLSLEDLGFRRDSRQVIREDLEYLAKNGLVAIKWHHDLMVVDLTRRGVEVSEGRVIVAGIKKPSVTS